MLALLAYLLAIAGSVRPSTPGCRCPICSPEWKARLMADGRDPSVCRCDVTSPDDCLYLYRRLIEGDCPKWALGPDNRIVRADRPGYARVFNTHREAGYGAIRELDRQVAPAMALRASLVARYGEPPVTPPPVNPEP